MTELLAPAGNWDCARAAVANGADAIFFGLPRFNARMRADNFTEADLPELMDFLHRHGVKGFVAFNTLVFANELEGAVEQIETVARAGVDAVIVQDLGAAKLVREIAPEMELHASTQMTITSQDGLRFADELLGLDRAVLARELSIRDIEKVSREGKVPLEVFVHGALCVAYSGQCLTSESLGQRSANRGECAQACRMPYELIVDGKPQPMGDVRYLLSPQDLAAVDVIPDLVKAGVVSYKIEGRLKTPEYVAAVTAVYRKALDSVEITENDRYTLEMMFSRGLTTGWLEGTNHPRLTHGKWGKKRGVYVGEIASVGDGWIELQDNAVSVKKGEGFVIDAGEDRNCEQGGTLFRVNGKRLTFDRRSRLQWQRVKPGNQLWKTSDPKLDSEVRRSWKGGRLVEKGDSLTIEVSGELGEPLIATCRGKSAASEIPLAKAENRPLSDDTLKVQFGRLGGTGFQLDEIRNHLRGDVILPLGELNRVRRKLVEQLRDEPEVRNGRAALASLLPERPEPIYHDPELRILCRTLHQVRAATEAGAEFIYCDFEDVAAYREAVAIARAAGATILLATPRIQKPSEAGFFKRVERAEPDGILVRNLGGAEYFKDHELRKVADFSLNVANPITARLLMEAGNFENLTISYDLNESQVSDLLAAAPVDWFELTLHQHMPMFHMEHCVFCTFLSSGTSIKDCGKPCDQHHVELQDRVGQRHILKADIGCRNTLFNGRAQTGARSVATFREAGLHRFRIELLDQTADEVAPLLKTYRDLLSGTTTATDVIDTIGATARLGVTEGTLEQRRAEVHR